MAVAAVREPVLSVRGLVRIFPRFARPPVVAVNGLDFDVYPGEILALLGPNGSGKTTTFRVIATLLPPTRGKVLYRGRDVFQKDGAYRRRLGYLPPEPGLYRHLTVREHLSLWAGFQGLSGERKNEAVARVVERFGLGSVLRRRAGQLSTGYRQRLALARTFLHEPEILVLDEPTRGVDVPTGLLVEQAMREARSEGRAVLFSTHLMEEVEHLADRIVVIHEGRKIAEGTLEDLARTTGERGLRKIFLKLLARAS